MDFGKCYLTIESFGNSIHINIGRCRHDPSCSKVLSHIIHSLIGGRISSCFWSTCREKRSSTDISIVLKTDASSMVSSAVCFSVDPTPIVESIVHHHQHHIQPCSSISRGRHLRISNRTSSTERNCHVTSLSLRIIFNHVRGAFFTCFGTFFFVMYVFQERL